MSSDPKLSGRPRRRAIAHIRRTQPNCWLCGGWIDQTLDHRHRLSSTVDEVIPRSRGGSATDPANLRHAHRACNSRRGNRPARRLPPPALAGARPTRSRAW